MGSARARGVAVAVLAARARGIAAISAMGKGWVNRSENSWSRLETKSWRVCCCSSGGASSLRGVYVVYVVTWCVSRKVFGP